MDTAQIKTRLRELINEHNFEENDAVDILKILSTFISKSDNSNDVVQAVVQEVLADYKTQMKVFIISYTKARISKVSKLLETLDKVEETIYNKVIAGNVDTEVLLALHKSINVSLKEIIALANVTKNLDVEPMVPGNFVQNFFLDNSQTNIEGDVVIDNKDRRMDLRIQLRKLFNHLEQGKTE